MNFEFTIEETNVIMSALGRAPYEAVFQLVEKIRTQAGPQLPANVTAPPQMPDPNFAGPVPVANQNYINTIEALAVLQRNPNDSIN